MKILIDNSYVATTSQTIELPINSWDEIDDFYVKWNTLYYILTNGTKGEIELNSIALDTIDWKRPSSTQIYDNNALVQLAEQ